MPLTLIDVTALNQRMLGSGPGLPPALPNYPARSATTVDGATSVLFGLPFMAAGVFTFFAAYNVIHSNKNAPAWVIAIVGAMFFAAGLFLFLHGARGIVRKSIYNRKAAETPGQPWLFDFHWHPEGITFSAFDSMVSRLIAAVMWNAFLLPFFWIGYTHRGTWPFLVVASFFALIGIIFWVRWLQMLGDLLRYGNTFLAYDEFPYFLGGSLRVRLRAPRHLAVLDSLSFTLRCIQEKYVMTGEGRNRSSQVVCYELYKDVLSLDRARLANFVGADIPVEFRLPFDKLPTTLVATPPTYWAIEARGAAHGADYQAYFLVPVYKKP